MLASAALVCVENQRSPNLSFRILKAKVPIRFKDLQEYAESIKSQFSSPYKIDSIERGSVVKESSEVTFYEGV